MGGPRGSRHQVAVDMCLIDADRGIVSPRETDLRSTGRVGATGTAFQDARGSEQLRAMAHRRNRFARGVKRLYQL